jgi:demethylmenaquinone methyltransferase / 2-methoxy-6-polyprenyl-1,4-benzoquinol methylase
MNDLEEFGLKEEWRNIEQILNEVIPVYDKTNRYISLGSDLKIRREGLDLLETSLGDNIPDLSIIDLGAGTGRLTQLLGQPSVMVDALLPMLQIASKRNINSQSVLAVFENLPFKMSAFRGAMAAFSIRDAKNLREALSQICNIVQIGGFFLIVDLSKPDSSVKRRIIGLYWKAIAPLIAFVVTGRKGLKFAALSTTFQRLPNNSEFVGLAQNVGFELISSRLFMLGGAGIFLFRKRF